MPDVNDRAICAVAGVRKPPKNEPAGDGAQKVPRTRLWGFGRRGRCVRGIAMGSRANDEASGGRQIVAAPAMRADAKIQLDREIAAESLEFCEKFGMRVDTRDFAVCSQQKASRQGQRRSARSALVPRAKFALVPITLAGAKAAGDDAMLSRGVCCDLQTQGKSQSNKHGQYAVPAGLHVKREYLLTIGRRP